MVIILKFFIFYFHVRNYMDLVLAMILLSAYYYYFLTLAFFTAAERKQTHSKEIVTNGWAAFSH